MNFIRIQTFKSKNKQTKFPLEYQNWHKPMPFLFKNKAHMADWISKIFQIRFNLFQDEIINTCNSATINCKYIFPVDVFVNRQHRTFNLVTQLKEHKHVYFPLENINFSFIQLNKMWSFKCWQNIYSTSTIFCPTQMNINL